MMGPQQQARAQAAAAAVKAQKLPLKPGAEAAQPALAEPRAAAARAERPRMTRITTAAAARRMGSSRRAVAVAVAAVGMQIPCRGALGSGEYGSLRWGIR
jgi:hypothetical protein